MTRNSRWFVADFLPRWLDQAMTEQGVVIEAMTVHGRPDVRAPTTLTQARLVFALAHLNLLTQDRRFLEAARAIHGFMETALRDPAGGYRLSTESALRRSYDQSFALMALTTLRRADPNAVSASRISELWRFVEEDLTDHTTGALWEDDGMATDGAAAGALRAQNPHMHMLEATLQAYEMTGKAVWMYRAAQLVNVARQYFIDPDTGAVREFAGSDLAPLDTPAGLRREPGHQYEWAWLLHRFADLGGDFEICVMANRMIAFVEAYGLRQEGPMTGAPFDAVDNAGRVTETTHLLWPLTEAGKFYAATGATDRVHVIEELIFGRYFTDGPDPVWSNQLSASSSILSPIALSRLIYHVTVFATEGARAGLWSLDDSPQSKTLVKETTK
jgi:mannose-6-phosphate isomerase